MGLGIPTPTMGPPPRFEPGPLFEPKGLEDGLVVPAVPVGEVDPGGVKPGGAPVMVVEGLDEALWPTASLESDVP